MKTTDMTVARLSAQLNSLRRVALAVAHPGGPGLYDELVRELAASLEVAVVFVAVFADDACSVMRTLAGVIDGRPIATFQYPLAGSPCERVVGHAFRYVATGLSAELSEVDDEMFIEAGIDSYAAFPLNDSAGKPLGLLAAMDRRTIAGGDAGHAEAMLKIFAVRAAAELERLAASEALQRSEASYRAIFETAEDAIFIHDWDTGAILDGNPKACETYGYSREELRCLSVAEISSGVPPYTAEDALRHIQLAKLGRCEPFEWHRRSKDGSLNWDEVRLKPAMIDGRPHILAFTRDITERRERELALTRSEARLRATVEAAFDCIIGMDGEGRIVEFNAAAERVFGHRRADVLGRLLADVILPEQHRAAHARGLRHFHASGRGPMLGRLVETTALRADGSEIPVELAISVATVPEGSIFVGHLRDISARRAAEAERSALEAQLRQAQKMEAIGQLTGGIAHDFNNILTSVIGYLVLAEEHAETLADATLIRQLGQAQLAAQRARDLIAQMLAFARRQRGEQRVLALAPLLRQTLQLLRPTLPSSVELDSNVSAADADDGALCVSADPVQLEQVLFNLCINARDAMDGAGRIRVQLQRYGGGPWHCASCRARIDGGRWVEFSVADNGCGIDPAMLERIFDPFFSTKAPGRGSGMGLAMVHGIVHDHGGHVRLSIVPGAGSVFSVMLPLVASPQVAVADAAQVHVADQPRPLHGRVLLVEDDPMVGDFLAERLTGWGLEAALLREPLAAAAWLDDPANDIDLLLTDQTMPQMTGLQLARHASSVRPGLPVVLVSGNAEAFDADELARSGVRVALTKPVADQRLREVLREALALPSVR
ncbi:MAG: PAS domain S-box protein [Azoarcus sp.]|nr:PAS domain S-box protein [Azoarcus sp.]